MPLVIGPGYATAPRYRRSHRTRPNPWGALDPTCRLASPPRTFTRALLLVSPRNNPPTARTLAATNARPIHEGGLRGTRKDRTSWTTTSSMNAGRPGHKRKP
jgi:hypothetical protein